MRRRPAILLFGLMLVTGSQSAIGLTPEERGLEIAREADARNTGWGDHQARMTMTLANKQGETSTREITIKTLEVATDGDKSLTIFHEPRDVKGTAFLSFSHPTTPDEQWIYLPALKRVKRISSANKSGPFMGSEFAFEDLSSFELEKYAFKYLGDETLDGEDVYVLEMYPQYEHSGYTRIKGFMDKAEYRMRKTEYYDRKDSLLKTLLWSDYRQYLDRYWRAHRMDMENHQTGKSTLLTFAEYQFAVGLNDSDFNKNELKRAR